MKYVRMLALAAVAAAALMAFVGAGTASATKLCSTTVDPCPAGQHWPVGTTLDFSSTNTVLKETGGGELDKCSSSTVHGVTSTTGSSTEAVKGNVTQTRKENGQLLGLSWEGCTFATKTLTATGLEVSSKVAGTSNGTVKATGTYEVTINTVLFGSCIYGVTGGKEIGTLNEGKPATFTAKAVAEKFSGSAFACPETSNWTGTYTLTTPATTTLSVTAG